MHIKQNLLSYFFALIFWTAPLVAQTTAENDSIYQSISILADDTNKIKQLFSLGYTLEVEETVLCKKVYEDALRISKKINNPYFECKTLINLGVLNKTHEKYDAALIFYKKAHAVAVQSGNPEIIGSSLANIGGIYAQFNDYEEAIKYTLEAVVYLEKVDKPRQLSLTIGNLCTYFERLKMYDKAIEFGLKSVSAAIKSGDERTIGLAYLNLSSAYFHNTNKDEYYRNTKLALKHLQNAGALHNICQAFQNLAVYYFEIKDITRAGLYADSSLQIARQLNHTKYLSETLMLKASADIEQTNFDNARNYLTEAKKYAQQDGGWVLLANCNRLMYQLENKAGNFKEALIYLQEKTSYDDSLKDKEILEKSIALEKKYETQKKVSQIAILEKEKKIQQLTISKKNNWLYATAAILVLLILVGMMFFHNTKRKQLLAQQQIQQLRQEKQLAAVSSILQTQEEERSRFAKDLHDGLGGMLSGVKLSLSSMKGNQVINEEHATLFQKSILQLDNAINEMRRVAHNMMPETLVKFGLIEAIQDYCNGINHNSGIQLKFTSINFPSKLPAYVEVNLYRIIQELSNNAIKHSGAKTILIELSKNQNILHLIVEDDGIGFDIEILKTQQGSGLKNVESRVATLKGKTFVEAEIGKGTTVSIEFPYQDLL